MDLENIESIKYLWNDFINFSHMNKTRKIPTSFYFCDNKIDANKCAELVLNNIKRATATSLWWFKKHNKSIPNVGDQYIVTDWNGNAKAIIENFMVITVPFNKISDEFAQTEGEGDKSLAYWRKVHEAYYKREMAPFNEKFDRDMAIVCEYFNKIYP